MKIFIIFSDSRVGLLFFRLMLKMTTMIRSITNGPATHSTQSQLQIRDNDNDNVD